MKRSFVIAVVLLAVTFDPYPMAAQHAQPSGAPCRVTIADTPAGWYGNALLSVAGLWSDGTIVFKPSGPGFVTSDGALGMKFGWMRRTRGTIRAIGRRLDGAAAPLRLEAPNGYGDIGFQASYLIFPTPGCWEVTAQVSERDDSKLTFVTKVVKIGDGPPLRRNPPTR